MRVGNDGIGPTIRRLRDERAWTQADLAHESGLDLRTIGRIERGDTRGSQDARVKLASAFKVSPAALMDPPVAQSSAAPIDEGRLDEYRRNLVRSIEPRVNPHVPLTTTDGDDVVDALLAVTHDHPVYLWGPSGSGKSHAMLTAAKQGAEQLVPIFARCISFRGQFTQWLAEALEAVAAIDLETLHLGAQSTGAKLVVFVDAINEVAPRLIDPLLEGVRGLLWSKGACVVLSGQLPELGAWSQALGFLHVGVAAPSAAQMIALAKVYELRAARSQQLLHTLRTPMDVAIAAEAWSGEEFGASRFALLHSFTRRHLRHVHPSVYTALAGLADLLKTRISRDLKSSEFERLLEPWGAAVVSSGLCQATNGYSAFGHDFFLDYFAAEHVLKQPELPAVAASLANPVFQDLTALVLEAQSDVGAVLELLRLSENARSIVATGLAGRHGAVVQKAVVRQVEILRDAVIADLQAHSNPKALRGRAWGSPDLQVASALGAACRSPLARMELAALLGAVEERVIGKLQSGTAGGKATRWFDLMMQPSTGHPVGQALLAARNVLQGFDSGVARTATERSAPDVISAPLAFTLHGYLLLAETRSRKRPLPGYVQTQTIEYVRAAVTSRVSYVFSEAMLLAHDCFNVLDAERRDEMRRLLRAIEPRGGLDDTWLLDALDMYGAVEPALDAEAIFRDVRNVLASPQAPLAQRSAFGLVNAASEPLSAIHMPHIDALSRLSSAEAIRLRAMAALGALAGDVGWRDPYIVQHILREPDYAQDELALVAIQRWATKVPELQMMGNQAVAAFVLAIEACARVNLEPTWPVESPGNRAEEAWRILGSLVFHSAAENPLTGHWESLRNVQVDALVPLLWIVGVDHWRDGQETRPRRFRDIWREALCALLRAVLSDPAFSSLQGFVPSADYSPAGAAVELLAEVGDLSDVERIRPLAGASIGPVAVAAIKSLRERFGSSRD